MLDTALAEAYFGLANLIADLSNFSRKDMIASRKMLQWCKAESDFWHCTHGKEKDRIIFMDRSRKESFGYSVHVPLK